MHLAGRFPLSRFLAGSQAHLLSTPPARRFSTHTEKGVYHAGLRNTVFTNEMSFSDESQVIPIFRVMNYDGEIDPDWKNPFTPEETLNAYKFMVRLSVWDDMMYNIQRQGRISFYIQNMGEEAAQTGLASAITVDDVLWCQYRELGVLMWRGFTLEDALCQLFSTKGDEGKGRQMPISYTKRDLNIQTIATPLTTQVPHAAGAGYAHKLAGEKRCSIAFFGEGAASEGDFHAALNFAAVLKSQTIFVCRNNGYAISTPVKDQYAGDGIAIRGLAYGITTIRVDGNDMFACHLAMKEARRICTEESKPVVMELMTYRMGHHSTSDDSSQYRPKGEYELWNQPGINPIARVRQYLTNHGLWDLERDEELRKEAKQTMLKQMRESEKKQYVPIVEGIFDDVYDVRPWYLQEQAEELAAHMKKYPDVYKKDRYEPGELGI
uniref:2-oxoisovalerate dehydrogenase subunit alpha n=1 Tax=Chromera velia CCMP2878 TaxID=1169474 RepID=A0A0G4HMK7_9ALVE|eukprot:Cvel_29199.t1-p1 / transcript=Cvel_29199.t1 / gene=Cvel_29199 / organism=Chromera_velia_CCMP2878 / gene_product=2-oxoisovalerate dehydrogenase subunit alpha,, putative / transcript_product=2-oxoisovalerate dehydrogenase subunit alpha,, putative / location=Cvel_scaffold3951:7366-12204(-) / protein_length=435 / sequence_SO=supercontig / SO=protein_coding / is_pseudo=false